MSFTLDFLYGMAVAMLHIGPLFLGLASIISVLSIWVGRGEGWSVLDSLYFGFITALTVGYGDLRPSQGRGKFIAVLIALLGLITTGVLVAVAVSVAGASFARQESAL
jgi:voltage-gated potassium channel